MLNNEILQTLVVDDVREGICAVNQYGDIDFCNQAAADMFGMRSDELEGHSMQVAWFGMVVGLYRNVWQEHIIHQTCRLGKHLHVEHDTFLRKNGSFFSVQYTATPLLDEYRMYRGALIVFQDITKREQFSDKLQRMMYYDILTNLPKNIIFQDYLNQSIEHANIYQHSTAILLLDLDQFSKVNELGRDIGDLLLQAATQRIISCISTTDVVARLGGDEFGVILQELKHSDRIFEVANLILETLSLPYLLDGFEIYCSCSIGIAVYPNTATDSDSLIEEANEALANAKQNGPIKLMIP